MNNFQLDIFNEINQIEEQKKAAKLNSIASDKQKGRLVAYDVGEKVGGSRKDIEELRRLFMKTPDQDILEEIEKEHAEVASTIVSKDLYFSWFSLEDCRNRGMEVHVAKSIESIIRLIAKRPPNNPVSRIKYMNTVKMVSELLRSTVTASDHEKVIRHLNGLIQVSRQHKYHLEDGDTKECWIYEMHKDFVQDKFDIDGLGRNFVKYFINSKSRRSVADKVREEFPDWDAVFQLSETKKTRAKSVPVWERAMPKEPTRKGPSVFVLFRYTKKQGGE
ncbi:hypothetical protein JOD03_002678 [Chryseomicrobium aureum]|uniref:hypothetical protein n=1 Tax=Chryseomicrobium aureum TaxID=1441723 RepID=UPI0019562089|nr:hypothetical protein [Chryseomicrobium aureum]MBM7707731.1 hypothetical protein [Chryseomicrobium aureum]